MHNDSHAIERIRTRRQPPVSGVTRIALLCLLLLPGSGVAGTIRRNFDSGLLPFLPVELVYGAVDPCDSGADIAPAVGPAVSACGLLADAEWFSDALPSGVECSPGGESLAEADGLFRMYGTGDARPVGGLLVLEFIESNPRERSVIRHERPLTANDPIPRAGLHGNHSLLSPAGLRRNETDRSEPESRSFPEDPFGATLPHERKRDPNTDLRDRTAATRMNLAGTNHPYAPFAFGYGMFVPSEPPSFLPLVMGAVLLLRYRRRPLKRLPARRGTG